MKSLLFAAAALAVGLSAPSFAGGNRYGAQPTPRKLVIVVSCFRGPLEEVIWDHPQPQFVDSLVALGYDYPTAHAIGERVCRDKSLVNNPEGLKRTMQEIYAAYRG